MEARLLLLAVLVAGVLAGPINVRFANDDTMCAQTCTESSKLRYRPGMTYEFDYNVQTLTTMEGASEEQATLGIKATAHVEILSKCELALQLRNVQVFQSDPSHAMKPLESDEFKRTLESHPLRFAFQDGVIAELCPVEGESSWALNIKRGVLSTFQNTMDTFEVDQSVHESDVTGRCMTDYKTSKSWYTTTISKTKNLLSCTDRQDFRSVLRTMPYKVSSDIQSLPLIKSEHDCTQEIDNRGSYLKNVLCKETHIFKPFSQQHSGAMTKIIQKLTYKTQRSGVTTRTGAISRRANMLFEHAKNPVSSEMQQHAVERKLQEICQVTKTDIRPEVPVMFSELVYLLRNLDTVAMRNIYRQVNKGSICSGNTERTKKIFLDSIPMVSTTSSVEMMKELLMNKEISGMTAEMWLTTLAFIQTPTTEMLIHVKSILEMRSVQVTAMLPISSLVNNFCSKTSDCADIPEVIDIIDVFEKILGSGCYVRDANLEKAIMTLRAIGNAGNSNTIGSTTLSNCITRTSNPMEVRVAALEAFRRMPCSAERRQLMSVFQDRSEDSELRIAAYLAVMRCPTEDAISTIKITLEAEDANQVGSFVWSHLTNLMETSSPHKQAIRSILEDARLKAEFNMDKLKYSRNYEGSFMLEKINTGGVVESNIIWSSKSFIPRSAMLNLTVDLFGNSVNLMEIGGRIEGLEYLLETYLGPLGYFGEKSTSRSVAKSKAKLDQLRGSMYMRMFGNEMAYTHFKGIDSFPKMKSFNMEDMLKKISKSHDYSFTQSIMFLDSSIIVPTAAGMPLNLTVNGVATVDMKASGKLDLSRITKTPSRIQIEGTVQPSGAVAITGCMSIDAFITKSGIRMTSTLHSSTSAKGRILVHGTKIISVEFDMPQDKMEILDVKTAFFVVHGNMEKEQNMITDNRKTAKVCTGSKLATISGLELCGEISFPNASMKTDAPYFPFTGPVAVSLILHKRDSHLGYRFMAKKTQSTSANVIQIAIDTPGSRVDRSLAFDFILNTAAKDLEIKMTSPWKKVSTRGTIINEADRKAFNGMLAVDGDNIALVNAETKVFREGTKVTYQPTVVIAIPLYCKYTIGGKVTIDGSNSATADITLTSSISPKSNIKFALMNLKNEKSISGSYNYQGQGEYSVLAKLGHELTKMYSFKLYPSVEIKSPKGPLAVMKGNCEYKSGKSLNIDASISLDTLMKKPISCSCNFNRVQRRNNQVKYISDIVFNSKLITVKIDGLMDFKNSGSMASRMIVDYQMSKSKKNKITFNSKYNNRSTKTLKKHTWNTHFEVKRNPELNIDSSIDMSHNSRHTDGKIDILVGQNPNHRLYIESTVSHKGSLQMASVNFEGNAKFQPLDINVQLKGSHKHNGNSLGSNFNLAYAKGKTIVSDLRLKDDSKKTTKKGGEFSLSYPGNDIYITTGLAQPSKKEMQHTLNLKIGTGHKSSIVTSYKHPRHDSHEFTSDIYINSLEPIHLSGETNLNLNNFKVGGQVDYGKMYRVATTSKYSAAETKGKLSFEVIYPLRHILVLVAGKKSGTKYSSSVETKWDAAKDLTQRVLLNGIMNVKSLSDLDGTVELKYPSRNLILNMKHSGDRKTESHVDFAWNPKEKVAMDVSLGHTLTDAKRNIVTTVSLSTPFDMLPKVTADLTYNSDADKYSSTSLLTWGRTGQQVSSNLSILKPVSLSHINLSLRATTPFNALRRLTADIVHDVNDKVNTVIKGVIGARNGEISITGANRGDYYKTDMDGSITLKSNIPDFESVILNGNVLYDSNKYQGNLALDVNGDRYMSDVDTTLYIRGLQIQTRGNVVLTGPAFRLTNNWNHRNSDGSIKSSITSEWDGKKLHIDVSGLHELSSYPCKIKGDVTIQTPWTILRDIEMSLNHEHASGFLVSSSTLKKNRKQIASWSINGRLSRAQGELDISITNPYTEDLSSKLNFKGSAYPITGHVVIQWAPSQVLAVEGTMNYDSPLTIDGTLRVTSPFEAVRSVVLKAANKHIADRIFASKASLEYGVRRSITVESRIRYDDNKELTLKMRTPFTNFRALDAQATFAQSAYEIDSKAEIEILPIWGKFSTVANAKWASDIIGNFRMDTPYASFPYLQIETTSSVDINGRHSRAEVEYSPRQIISFQSTHNFAGPVTIDVNVITPFAYIENVGAAIKHSSRSHSIQTHAEIRYAPSKQIDGDCTMRWYEDIEGMVVVNTPFSNYEMTKIAFRQNGNSNDFSSHSEIVVMNKKIDSDVSFSFGRKTQGEFSFHSPFTGFEEIRAKAEMGGKWERMRMISTITYGQSKEIQAVLRNSLSGLRLDTTFTLKTPFFNNFKLSIDHDGDLSKFTNKFSTNLGRQYTFNTDTTFDMRLPTIDLSGSIYYRIPEDTKRITINVHKDGEWDNLSGHIIGDCNGKALSIRGNIKSQSGLEGLVNIASPYTEDIVLSVSHNGGLSHFTTKASANIGSDYIISTDNSFQFDLPTIDISNYLTFRYAGIGNDMSLITHSDSQMGGLNGKITATVDGTEYSTTAYLKSAGPIEASITINTPLQDFREVSATFKHSGHITSFATSGSVQYTDANTIAGNVNFFTTGLNRIDASAVITTPFINYERTEYKYNQNMDYSSLISHAEISYGYSKNIVADINVSVSPKITGRIIITTPFEGFLNNRIHINGEGSLNNFKLEGETELFGETLNIQSAFTHDSDTSGRFLMIATSPNVKNIEIVFNRNGNMNDFTSTSTVTIGRKTAVDVRITGRFIGESSSFSINFKNPYTDDINASFRHEGQILNCRTIIEASLGTNTNVHSETTIKSHSNIFEASTEGRYALAGEGESMDAYVKSLGDTTQNRITIGGKYAGKAVDSSISYNLKNGLQMDVSVTTPIDSYRNLAFSLKHSGRPENFNTETSVRYMDGKEVSAEVNFYRYLWNNIKSSLSVNTPFSGYETSKISYEHNTDGGISGNCNVEYGRRQKLSTNLKLTKSPKYSVELTVATPFPGYESIAYTASVESSYNRHNAEASFKMGDYKSYTMNANLNMNDSPMTGSLRMYTPISMLKNVDLSFSNSGSLDNFRTFGSLESPITGIVSGEASLFYTSPFVMDGSIVLKSSLPNMEELKFVVRNTKRDEYRSHVDLGWQPTRQVSFDGGYKLASEWYSKEFNGDISITTPFTLLRDLTVKTTSSKGAKKYASKIEADYNHETILDIDSEITFDDKCEGGITMHKPRPVEFTWTGMYTDALTEADIFVNWNRDTPNSNIRLLVNSNHGSVKDLSIRVVNPLRTVAMKGSYQNNGYQTKSHGEFSWDEQLGRKIFYELDAADNSRRYTKMYDASLKVGAPSRTVLMKGSFSDTSNTKSVNTAFLWDADKDITKQIGIKGNFMPSDKKHKADVIITLPNNQQDIRIGAEMTVDSGRTLFDGKTEFSYSPDSRKTLVLMSNLKDVSYDRGHNNYSLSLGISHPYTDTDVQITSHIGSSIANYACGMQMQYLTASRQKINLALLGDIDRLRKQINLQVASPLKNIEMTAEVKSTKPFQLVLNSRLDGHPAAVAAVSVDTEAKSVHFETNYDIDDFSNMFHVEAKYVNASSVMADVYLDGHSRKTQSLIAVTLESPRVLQTRISWKPEIMKDLKFYAGGQWRRFSTEVGSTFEEVTGAIGDELAQKYRIITEAISEEVTSYADLFVRELEDLEGQLHRFTTELRRLHSQNDWYIKSMGDYAENYVLSMIDSYSQSIRSFNSFYTENTESLSQFLEDMKSYPIRENYRCIVDSAVEQVQQHLDTVMEASADILESVDEQLKMMIEMYNEQNTNIKEKISESIENFSSQPQIQLMKSKLAEIRDMDYIGRLKNNIISSVSDFNIPEKYNSVIYNTRELVGQQLTDVMKRDEIKYIQDRANEVYQQGKWAYGYWRIEENVEEKIRELFTLLKQIIEDELVQYKEKIRFLSKSKFTIYEPENGVIQAELYLPIPLSNLEAMPDTSDYVAEVNDLVVDYIPSKQSLTQMYEDYMPTIWGENNTSVVEQAPLKKMTRRQRRYRS